MASYHLSVKTIKRSAGRSATAAAAYRSASVIACDREGRMHDYTAKRGVEACFILAPDDAPSWAQDRAALWNAAEARETRSNSVTAREWELALPSEISDAARIEITRAFAAQLVEAGIDWTFVSGEKISRACADFPVVFGSGGINCDPPNKADQVNPPQANYRRISISRGCAWRWRSARASSAA